MSAPGQTVTQTDKSTFIPTQKQIVCAMALVCERGPVAEPRTVVDWPDFLRTYGGYVDGQVGQHSAKRALDAGCWLTCTRIVHYADPTDASTKTSTPASVTVPDRSSTATHGQATGSGAFPARITPGGTLVVAIDGGGDLTATFHATRASKTGAGATYAAVTAGHKLVLLVNGVSRSVAFGGTENSQALFLDAINAAIPGISAVNAGGQVELQTDRFGSSAAITVDASSDADVLTSLGLTAGAGTNAGPNDVADTEAVSAAEFTSVVQGAITGSTAGATGGGAPFIRSNTTGDASSVKVQGSSTLASAFGFDTSLHSGAGTGGVNTVALAASSDGAWGDDLDAVVDDDPGDPATRFRVRLVVRATGEVVETWPALSMAASDARYVVNVLREQSDDLRATDLASPTAAPGNRPANGTYPLAGGNDGLSGLVAGDWLGDANAHTGLHALDTERGMRLLSLPGVTDAEIQADAVAYCAGRGDLVPIFSAPLTSNPTDAIAFRRGTSPYAFTAIDTFRGAMYFGWHEILHPVTRAPLWIPIDGEVLKALALSNQRGGVWYAPAGPQRGVLDASVRRLKYNPSPAEMDRLYDAGLNVVYKDDDFGFVINGQKTLQKADSAKQRLNVVLLCDFIGEQLRTNTKSGLFEPNDPILWADLRERCKTFLDVIGPQRALNTTDGPGYRLDIGATNTEVQNRQTHLNAYVIPQETSEEQAINLIVMPAGTVFAST
jgi:hypothetical protein